MYQVRTFSATSLHVGGEADVDGSNSCYLANNFGPTSPTMRSDPQIY